MRRRWALAWNHRRHALCSCATPAARENAPLLSGRGYSRHAREAGSRRKASAALSRDRVGKTYIAVQLLRKIAAAGQLRRALFVCDRDELRNQALTAFQNEFGADAAAVSGGNPQKNARILIATYQTLDVDTDEAAATFLVANYPENYFGHIVIDECHRSAWGKWSQVLTRNPDAIQVGLTATPRQLEVSERSREAEADRQVNADNLRHFGEPVYEYDMGQGIEDGYLAACEILRRDIFLDDKPGNERETGVEQADPGTRRSGMRTPESLWAGSWRAPATRPRRSRIDCSFLSASTRWLGICSTISWQLGVLSRRPSSSARVIVTRTMWPRT